MSVSPRMPQGQGVDTQAPVEARPRRTWPRKFGDAFRGLKRGIRGQSSFSVHLFFAALAIAAGIVLRCTLEQWGLLLLCIGLVFSAELFNSAIETLFRGLDEETRARAWPCLDIAAGAVLVACIAAAIVGSLIFFGRIAEICKLFLDT